MVLGTSKAGGKSLITLLLMNQSLPHLQVKTDFGLGSSVVSDANICNLGFLDHTPSSSADLHIPEQTISPDDCLYKTRLIVMSG